MGATLECAGDVELRRRLEAVSQELHAARRSHQTALDVQLHLTAELDAAIAEHTRQLRVRDRELATARDQLTAARDQLADVLSEREELLARISALDRELQSSRHSPQTESPPPASPPAPPPPPPRTSPQDSIEAEALAEALSLRQNVAALMAELEEVRTALAERGAEARAAREREREALAEAAALRAESVRPPSITHGTFLVHICCTEFTPTMKYVYSIWKLSFQRLKATLFLLKSTTRGRRWHRRCCR